MGTIQLLRTAADIGAALSGRRIQIEIKNNSVRVIITHEKKINKKKTEAAYTAASVHNIVFEDITHVLQ